MRSKMSTYQELTKSEEAESQPSLSPSGQVPQGRQAAERHLPELDGVRGAACLMVLIHHYITGLWPLKLGSILWTVEAITRPFMLSGVDLLFVLSGFLIGGILFDNRGSPNYFKTFYIRRICRIFPVYYLLCFTFIVGLHFQWSRLIPGLSLWLFKLPMPIWSYLTFTQNFAMAGRGDVGAFWLGITWSLAVEEQFYLIFPLIVALLPRRFISLVGIAALIAVPFCRFAALHHNWFASYVLLPCRMDTLLVGVLVAYIVRSARALAFVHRHANLVAAGAVAPAIVLISQDLGFIDCGTLSFSLLALMYGAMILIVSAWPEGRLSRLFRLRPLVQTGVISYAIYMYHQAVNGVMHAVVRHQEPRFTNLQDAAVTSVSIILVFALARISYVFLERPIRQYGRRFKY